MNEQTPPGIKKIQHKDWLAFFLDEKHWYPECEKSGCQILEIEVEGIGYSVNQKYKEYTISSFVFRQQDSQWWANLQINFVPVLSLPVIKMNEDTHLPAKDQPSGEDNWNHVVSAIATADLFSKVKPDDANGIIKWKKEIIDKLSKEFVLYKRGEEWPFGKHVPAKWNPESADEDYVRPSPAPEQGGERDQYTKGYMQGISDMVNKPKDQKIESLQAEIQRLQSRISSLEADNGKLVEALVAVINQTGIVAGTSYDQAMETLSSFTDKPVKS